MNSPFTGKFDLLWRPRKTQYKILKPGARESQMTFGKWPTADVYVYEIGGAR